MATGLRPFVVILAVIIVFTFAIIGYIPSFVSVSNPSSPLLNSTYGLNASKNAMSNVFLKFENKTQTAYNEMAGSEPSATDYLFLIFRGAFYIPFAMLEFVALGIPALSEIMFSSFGKTGSGIILTIVIVLITSSLILTGILLLVKAIRTGESER